MPYPDEDLHPRRQRRRHLDARRQGEAVATVLDRHFADVDAHPSRLADAFHDLDVPLHGNDHIRAAALRADRDRVRATGRWLVRHATDRCAVLVGLALLATDGAKEDIPLIQTIGLLSYQFGPLAADALRRRRGGAEALEWLAERSDGWGRVYLVEALCRVGAVSSRDWLLRRACDGDVLNGYYAGDVAIAADVCEAITAPSPDDELIDHTGRLLHLMADAGGMGTTLGHYPSAPTVLAAHARLLAGQEPTTTRFLVAALLTDSLQRRPPERSGCTAAQRDAIVEQYVSVLDRPDWCEALLAGLNPQSPEASFLVGTVAPRLPLRALADLLSAVRDDPPG
ncbi:MAG: hypothetical protein U0Q15_06845 [Kineosporiaceae bacterium]